MWFLKLALFLWISDALKLGTDASACPKGQRVVDSWIGRSCTACPAGYYQDEENTSQECKACRNCDANRGSVVADTCTPVQNVRCKCRENFVPEESDSTTCKCADGYYKKNQDCVPKPTTSNRITPLLTSLTSPRPQEGAQTQKPTQNNTISNSHPGSTTTTKERTRDSYMSNIILGLIFVMVALFVLTALICKQIIVPHMNRKPEQTRDPSFRKPVEESGDGSQDSLKQNPEEP